LLPDGAFNAQRIVYQSVGPRRLRADGTVLDLCAANGPPCRRADLEPGTITKVAADGSLATVDGGGSQQGRAIDVSFAVDGTSTWILRQTEGPDARVTVGLLDGGGVEKVAWGVPFSGVDTNASVEPGSSARPDDS
jgi:hypothetical protein